MNTFWLIMAVTPWSLLAVIAIRALRKTRVYGKFWLVSEKYLDAYDPNRRNEGSEQLILVKEVSGESVDEESSSGVESPRPNLAS